MDGERRKYRRVNASSVIWYEITDMQRLQTTGPNVEIGIPQQSVDISLGGARIYSHKPIEPDKNLKVIISIPGIKTPISIIARVVWCEESPKEKNMFMIGLQFMEFINEKRAELAKYIDSLPDLKESPFRK
jgi:c-di-GMP-binding flagellar brake protein YcgR